jgi:hypothetical protein
MGRSWPRAGYSGRSSYGFAIRRSVSGTQMGKVSPGGRFRLVIRPSFRVATAYRCRSRRLSKIPPKCTTNMGGLSQADPPRNSVLCCWFSSRPETARLGLGLEDPFHPLERISYLLRRRQVVGSVPHLVECGEPFHLHHGRAERLALVLQRPVERDAEDGR